jgi:hypothetical protein
MASATEKCEGAWKGSKCKCVQAGAPHGTGMCVVAKPLGGS